MNISWLNSTALVLTVIGGINWGLIGLFDFNLVALLFGELPILLKIIYILVGLAACYTLYVHFGA